MKKLISLIIIFVILNMFIIENINLAGNEETEGYIELTKPSLDNGAYFNNISLMNFYNGDIGDPFIIQDDEGYYHIFTTNNEHFKTKTLSGNASEYINMNGFVDGYQIPNQGRYVWAPEVYYYNNKYYVIFSAIYWGNGQTVSKV